MTDASFYEVDACVRQLGDAFEKEYNIEESYFADQSIKRGLRNADGSGVVAGVTRIGSVIGYLMGEGTRVPQPGKLYYRGIDVEDIVASHRAANTFGYEEVAYLLLMGTLPDESQLEIFNKALSKARQLPEGFFEDMILKAPSPNVMNKLNRGVLSLYSYDENPDDTSPENMLRQSIELIARFPTIVADAYAVKKHYYDGESLYIHNPKEHLSVSENFLRLVRHHKNYTDEEAKLLDTLFMLHAEHGAGNCSTFACRTVASSGADTYSAIAAAVGALKGPLHGGAANAAALMIKDMRENIRDVNDDEEVTAYLGRILDGRAGDMSGKIYGLGHAVYTMSDPRAQLLKKYARSVAEKNGRLDEFVLVEDVERLGAPLLMSRKHMNFPICANVDLYSGFVYSMLGIPDELYTPMFAVARISGWCAHRIEEVLSSRRLIRPAYRNAAVRGSYVPMEQR